MSISEDDVIAYYRSVFDNDMFYLDLEPLPIAVIRGTLSQYEASEPSLDVVNARDEEGRTLLHLAVWEAKIDSVERLLQWGADISVQDALGATPLDLVDVIHNGKRIKDSEERKGIRKLLHLVSKRESVLRGVSEGRELAAGGDSDSVSLVAVEGLGQEVKHQREVLSTLKEDLAQHVTQSLKKDVVTELQVIRTALTSRDELLEKLETSITSLVEESHSTWGKIGARIGVVLGDRNPLFPAKIPAIITCNEAAIRMDCVEELMKRTELFSKTDDYVTFVRNLYEKVYETNPVVCFLPRFSQTGSEWQIVIDCSSGNIANIRKRVVDLNGKACDGKQMVAFADLKERVVYLGAKVDANRTVERVASILVMSLAQMANLLAFENEGRPYRAGSGAGDREELYKDALKELDENWESDGYAFDFSVNPWIKSSSPLQKEVSSITVVPGMIAHYGLPDGLLRARRKMRSLTRFYEDHVVPELEQLLVSRLPLS